MACLVYMFPITELVWRPNCGLIIFMWFHLFERKNQMIQYFVQNTFSRCICMIFFFLNKVLDCIVWKVGHVSHVTSFDLSVQPWVLLLLSVFFFGLALRVPSPGPFPPLRAACVACVLDSCPGTIQSGRTRPPSVLCFQHSWALTSAQLQERRWLDDKTGCVREGGPSWPEQSGWRTPAGRELTPPLKV